MKHLILLKIQNTTDVNVDLLEWFINFLKKTFGGTVKNEIMSNKGLAEELEKPIIRKSKKRKVHSSFIKSIWSADFADMQGFRILLRIIDIHRKYAWVVPLKDKKGITITNVFKKVLDESKRKPSKIWVDKGSEFYNRSIKSFFAE